MGQGRECEDPPGTGGGRHVMWAWERGGLEVNRLHSPNSLSLMSTGGRDCWVEEGSEDEREPGSILLNILSSNSVFKLTLYLGLPSF